MMSEVSKMDDKLINKFIKPNWTKGLIADYKPTISVDGEGFRCSLYVSGCLFACPGCYNKSIQDFNVGVPYDDELKKRILADLSKPYIQGLTLLGGEPMLNTDVCLDIAKECRATFGQSKDIWCWTGYTWTDLLTSIDCNTKNSKKQKELLSLLDVLVDGPYIEELKDKTGQLKFRGSTNQRIIDVKESLRVGQVVELTKFD